MSPYFRDPDGESLDYSAASSNTNAVMLALDGDALTVTGVGAGQSTVTVTATDPAGASVGQSFGVDVSATNRAPVVRIIGDEANTWPTRPGFWIETPAVNLFFDPDRDPLTFTAESSDTLVVKTEIFWREDIQLDILRVEALKVGTATITVTATDPHGESVTLTRTLEITASSQAHLGRDAYEANPGRSGVLTDLAPLPTMSTGLAGRVAAGIGEPEARPNVGGDALIGLNRGSGS